MSLQKQAENIRAEEYARKVDPVASQAAGRLGRDCAADANNTLLQAARRIARELGQHGPITMDDVTYEMNKSYNVASAKGKCVHQWKGSVFTSSEWVMVGKDKAKTKVAHGRYMGQWALKTWLAEHSMNGRESLVSAFSVSRIYREFQKTPMAKRVDGYIEKLVWRIGDQRLADDLKANIKQDGGLLYGIAVQYCPGAVGATLGPKDPSCT